MPVSPTRPSDLLRNFSRKSVTFAELSAYPVGANWSVPVPVRPVAQLELQIAQLGLIADGVRGTSAAIQSGTQDQTTL